MKTCFDKESYFIKQFVDSKHIGDDGAVIQDMVYSMDAFFENVHFKREWMSLEQIAQKAMLVNISDAIVMNARPKYALLSVAIPKSFSKEELSELAQGFSKTAKEYGVEIIGGDTISNEKLDISVTIVSQSSAPVYRTGLEIGDVICYTGELGSVKKDLETLLEGKRVSESSKFIKPQLKPNFFYEIAPFITSSMDISDGLFFELERLSKNNNLGFDFFAEIPNDIGCSGEEYEILFSCNESQQKQIEKIAEEHNVKISFFAKAIEGSFESPCNPHHFK